jgi:hypothetical protein
MRPGADARVVSWSRPSAVTPDLRRVISCRGASGARRQHVGDPRLASNRTGQSHRPWLHPDHRYRSPDARRARTDEPQTWPATAVARYVRSGVTLHSFAILAGPRSAVRRSEKRCSCPGCSAARSGALLIRGACVDIDAPWCRRACCELVATVRRDPGSAPRHFMPGHVDSISMIRASHPIARTSRVVLGGILTTVTVPRTRVAPGRMSRRRGLHGGCPLRTEPTNTLREFAILAGPRSAVRRSEKRCSCPGCSAARSGALLIRGACIDVDAPWCRRASCELVATVRRDPGSAPRHFMPRRVRGTSTAYR